MTLRYEQRREIIAAARDRGAPAKVSDHTIGCLIDSIEDAGFRIVSPTEPTIQGVVLTETLKRDAHDALIDRALALEAEAGSRTTAMRAAMRRRAGVVRDLADHLLDMKDVGRKS